MPPFMRRDSFGSVRLFGAVMDDPNTTLGKYLFGTHDFLFFTMKTKAFGCSWCASKESIPAGG